MKNLHLRLTDRDAENLEILRRDYRGVAPVVVISVLLADAVRAAHPELDEPAAPKPRRPRSKRSPPQP